LSLAWPETLGLEHGFEVLILLEVEVDEVLVLGVLGALGLY